MKCRKCGSGESVKNGWHLGRQRYKCKECGFQYTREHPKGKSVEIKCLAVILYVNGLSFRAIAKIVCASPKAVYDWVKAFGLETSEKPKSPNPVIVDLDAIRHSLSTEKAESAYDKHLVALQVNSLADRVEIVLAKIQDSGRCCR